jgi:hypothetical protein
MGSSVDSGFSAFRHWVRGLGIALFCCAAILAQVPAPAERGSAIAKGGFRNETEIAGKFNAWKTDTEAKIWLVAMGYRAAEIESVEATKPHGEKSDVVVAVTTRSGTRMEGISIKLVSTAKGFNQIDKRWLSHYVEKWKMPKDVADSLKLFLGETKPARSGRNADRLFLDELDGAEQRSVVAFFEANRSRVAADLFMGDGPYSAKWILVAQKAGDKPRWELRSIGDAMKYFSDGKVTITRGGNLRIGRITMQRKGGDGGRETAKMLQFKIDPAELFDLK